MKLRIVPPSHGVQWVRLGIRTFLRQPLALSGLFFLFLAAASVLSMVPVLGNLLALMLVPGATLGLIAAAREAAQGRFPMPWMLITAFRAGPPQLRAMLQLGALYAAATLVVFGISALFDGGTVARLYFMGGTMTPELVKQPDFQSAVLVVMALYLPLSLLFWHAPALTFWHGISPVKSLFFSFMACVRNFWTFVVFFLLWVMVGLGIGMLVAVVASLVGSQEMVGVVMFPATLLIAAMFFTSIYFTFIDSFELPLESTP